MSAVDYFEAGSKTTLARMFWPLMFAPSVDTPGRCAVCGRACKPERHHIVFRSQGRLFDIRGREIGKPTITLCGFGNNLFDADGRPYCHGMAHHRMLHFRLVETYASKVRCGPRYYGSHLEYLFTEQPADYLSALAIDGWKAVGL